MDSTQSAIELLNQVVEGLIGLEDYTEIRTLLPEKKPELVENEIPSLEEQYTDIVFKKTKLEYDLDEQLDKEDSVLVQERDPDYKALFARFNLKSVPQISVLNYIKRLAKMLNSASSVLVTASLYIVKIVSWAHERDPAARLTRNNCYRMILASIRVAEKLIEDLVFKNGHFARISGVKERQLVRLEHSMLVMLNFEMKVDRELLEKHVERMGFFGSGEISQQHS